MRQICVMFVLVAGTALCMGGKAQSIQLDLTLLDSSSFAITGPGLNVQASGNAVRVCNLSGSGACEMSVRLKGKEVSKVKFSVDNQSRISDVQWKTSGPLPSVYDTLPAGYYSLEQNSKRIKFKPSNVFVDFRLADLDGMQLLQSDAANTSGGQGNSNGNPPHKLFPGFYEILSPNSKSSLAFYMRSDGALHPELLWRDNLVANSNWEKLHGDFYSVNGNRVDLAFQAIGYDMRAVTTQSFRLPGMKTAKVSLSATSLNSRLLLPGTYNLRIAENGSDIVEVRYRLLNQTGQLSPDLEWKDLVGNRTGGQFVIIDPGLVVVDPFAINLSIALPWPLVPVNNPGPYAVLKDKLDAGYYLAKQGRLFVRYDERYDVNDVLNMRILNSSNLEVPLFQPIYTLYGSNWIQMILLPASNYTVGEYYVLEVRGPKGDLSMLRFRYEN